MDGKVERRTVQGFSHSIRSGCSQFEGAFGGAKADGRLRYQANRINRQRVVRRCLATPRPPAARSGLITLAVLIVLNRLEQLRAHLERARANGVTKDEIVEVITHLAFYAGWPNAVNAVAIAREVYH